MRALRSAPIGLVFFLLTLTYIDVGNPELSAEQLSEICGAWCVRKACDEGKTTITQRQDVAENVAGM